ncbi:SulP family inorganic anion transporter [Christiangramia forsetii]|uniref:Sulfate transporter family protein n=2 Tax=Christiangramia forsetii TaxID=411153 RepID=A0M6W4_CHRFK|nr:SulP family inorganic anion transporter [Christiangramia forsetii]GGG29348.1 membrane protein [Christiangramia forsetii]CAL68359.1 sulfate transporter family protein [Christiangramia forsetii KT0803]
MFKHLNKDFPASVVVFFVALPLCLGIALASGAPLFSGLIAGIVGGIVVGAMSGANLGVSGPAAGLAAIVLVAISSLGGYENFLLAVVIAGAMQIVFGVLKAGIIGYYFPSSVIKGMLTGIGIIIVLKQIPHFFGYDADPQGDWAFFQANGENTFSELFNIVNNISPGATLIAIIGMSILILWEAVLSKKGKIFKLVQGPLVAVVVGIVFFILTKDTSLAISNDHLVTVPVPDSFDSFIGQFTLPSFSMIGNPQIWITAFTIALVASLETLLSVEAIDKLDPHKRTTPTNRELFAQGTGNMVSGLIGGLPVTQVIVRSSANVQSGGQTKMSAIIHGFLLLISVIIIPNVLNLIPLSVLAAVLFLVGYKLAKPALFIKMYKAGWKQFVPFVVTIVGIVFGDLLIGISLGLIVGIFVILIKSYQNSYFLHIENVENGNKTVKMRLAEEVTFINKGAILKELNKLEKDSYLIMDVSKTRYLDNDIVEILDDFKIKAEERNINIKIISERGTVENPDSYQQFFELDKKPA